jgi:hypothetical protein
MGQWRVDLAASCFCMALSNASIPTHPPPTHPAPPPHHPGPTLEPMHVITSLLTAGTGITYNGRPLINPLGSQPLYIADPGTPGGQPVAVFPAAGPLLKPGMPPPHNSTCLRALSCRTVDVHSGLSVRCTAARSAQRAARSAQQRPADGHPPPTRTHPHPGWPRRCAAEPAGCRRHGLPGQERQHHHARVPGQR